MIDLVSIIMPSYNTARFLQETIDSVLAQTYQNWELIIVDDCSTDDTASIVESIKDDRIRFFQNETNSGAAVSRNRALREARGRWIAFLDSDDLWEPKKLEKQIFFMEENNCSFSYTNYLEIDEESRPLGRIVTGPKRITKTGMYSYCWPGCLTVMYDAEKLGMLQIEDIKKNNDYAMWLKLCKKADCLLLDEVLASYRRREGSISNHSYIKLIRWHYLLFREAEKMGAVRSGAYTLRNLLYGVYKKLWYAKREEFIQ
jgi:glycosyltransferase involved in cell wall biosynthesis